jgi:hypothetical protein
MRMARLNLSLGASGGMARKSNRGQAFAAHAAAIGQRGTATLGALASQETMLANPATFGRLILSFHKFYFSSGANLRALTNSGKSPKIGTREHISELSSVKNAALAASPPSSPSSAKIWRRRIAISHAPPEFHPQYR